MAVTDYSSHRWGDPDVAVLVTYDGQSCPIDARRKRDGTWEALVRFTVQRDGYPHTRRSWFAYADLELVQAEGMTERPGEPHEPEDPDAPGDPEEEPEQPSDPTRVEQPEPPA